MGRQDTPLPHDLDAEMATLSGILLDPDKLDQLDLKPGYFYDARSRDIFRAMSGLRKAGTPLTWVRMHEACGQLGSYLAEVFDYTPSAAYLFDHARVVREKAVKRTLLQQVARISERANNGTQLSDLSDMLTEAREGLQEPEAADADPSYSVADILNAEIEAQPWVLDGELGVGQLSILTSQPGGGKTTLAWHLVKAAVRGTPFLDRDVQAGGVVYMSLEEGIDAVEGAYERMDIEETDQLRVLFGDEVLHSPAVWALIDEHWPPPGIDPETCSDEELTPEPDSSTDHAMLLADLLTQRGHNPKQQAIMDKYRAKSGAERYSPARNAAAVIEQFKALAASA